MSFMRFNVIIVPIALCLATFLCCCDDNGNFVISSDESQKEISAPFHISDYFFPSGWMGDGERGEAYLAFLEDYTDTEHPREGDPDSLSIKIVYNVGSKGWAGIYWQYPENNCGEVVGYKINGASRILFWARGETGMEKVEFKAGGRKDLQECFKDSFEKTIGTKILSTEWLRYEIDLSGEKLSNVIGGFCWVATSAGNPKPLTFYLDDIWYE